MRVNIVTSGFREIQNALKQYEQQARAELERAVTRAAYRVHRRTVRRIQDGPKTGRVYEKYDPRRTHQASAPNEAPASDTGRLASSYNVRRQGLNAWVYSDVYYARILEFGDAAGDLEPRPHLFPSLEEEAPQFIADIRDIL